MNVTAILLSTLAGCTAGWNCNPDEEDFDLDEELTTADLDAIVEDWGLADWDDVECDTACSYAYSESRGWQMDSTTSCTLELPVDEDNPGSVSCTGHGYEYFCEGRRPIDHEQRPVDGPLAAMAQLEADSVVAFEELAEQLAVLGAGRGLVERCRAAAEDERNHARWISGLAGTSPPMERRGFSCDLEQMALHNAVEGCAHETFAALNGLDRARRMRSPELRRVFTRIALDELRHAQLAWDLHAWFRSRVADPAALDAARAEALASLPERARLQALAMGAPVPRAVDLAKGMGAALAAG